MRACLRLISNTERQVKGRHAYRSGDIVNPFGVWLMRLTNLGNPLFQPWRDLSRMSDKLEMEEFLLGSYYICRGRKAAS
jgi:hypothetical protein